MKLNEVYAIADAIAPKSVGDTMRQQMDMYDNSGILVDCGDEITSVLFVLDLTHTAIDKAIAIGANLIVTHHPAIFSKIGSVRVDDDNVLGGKLVKCLRSGISVISMHLNLDFSFGGTDESLMDGIVLSAGAGMEATAKNVQCMNAVGEGAYGRAYDLSQSIAFSSLVKNMAKTFETKRILSYGDTDREISRVASFCGSGLDEQAVVFAKKQGADAVISSDIKHHVLLMALESGISVISLTHYASEVYGMKKYYEKIRRQVGIPCAFHTDEYLL